MVLQVESTFESHGELVKQRFKAPPLEFLIWLFRDNLKILLSNNFPINSDLAFL